MEIVWNEEFNRDKVIDPCCKTIEDVFGWAVHGDPIISSTWRLKAGNNILDDTKSRFEVNYCPWCGTKIDKESHGG